MQSNLTCCVFSSQETKSSILKSFTNISSKAAIKGAPKNATAAMVE